MKILKYILAVFFILGGLSTIMEKSFMSALFMLILGIIFLPPISEQLKEKFNLWQSKGLRYVSYIVLFFISGAFLPDSGTTFKKKSEITNEKFESKKKFIVELIKNDTIDKSLKTARSLSEIGDLFNNRNYSFEHPKNYVTEQYDSINKNTIVTFNPKFDFTDEDRTTYLVENNSNGKLQDYIIQFTINDKNEIISKKTIITYSKSGKIEYTNDEIPYLSSLVDNELVTRKKSLIEIEKQAIKQKEEHEKRVRIFEEECISSWDHSHRGIIKLVKQSMHNPKSFEHVETKYGITDDYAGIIMVYRGTNMYGAIVTNSIKAKVSLDDCSIISIEE